MSEFKQTGGARLDLFNASWPFARLRATPHSIELKVLTRTYTFAREDIRTLSLRRGVFSTGLQIGHGNGSVPSKVVFWTFDYRALRAALEGFGYEFED